MSIEPNATLTERLDITEELAVVRVAPDDQSLLSFVPGQYAEIAVLPTESGTDQRTRPVRRAYSIASAPGNGSALELYITRVEDGVLTPQLWDLRRGTRLWVGPKVKGKFTLENVPADRDLIFVGTGTGIAPFISMLRYYRANPPWRRLTIVHGVRLARDLGYDAELHEIARERPDVFYIPMASREPIESGWPGERGRVQRVFETGLYEAVTGAPLTPEESHVFLCGNPQMIESLQSLLEGRGFRVHRKKEPGNIHFERYW